MEQPVGSATACATAARRSDVRTAIAFINIDVHPVAQARAFSADHFRTGAEFESRWIAERHHAARHPTGTRARRSNRTALSSVAMIAVNVMPMCTRFAASPNRGFDHGERRGIGRDFGAPDALRRAGVFMPQIVSLGIAN